jgi:predicted nucleic acid-binding protein
VTLVDTDVLIDAIRGFPPALEWLRQNERGSFQIPGIVAMEIVQGSRNAADLKRLLRFLHRFDLVWPNAEDFVRAYSLLTSFRLTTGLRIADCLIAAMALNRSALLYTFNLKHFQAVPGLNAVAPYSR